MTKLWQVHETEADFQSQGFLKPAIGSTQDRNIQVYKQGPRLGKLKINQFLLAP